MKKLAVFAFSALAAFIGWCGYLSYHYEAGEDNSKGLYSPNAMHRVQQPPVSPGAVLEEQAVLAAATGWHDELQINGKQIVVSSRGNMLDPERHDMAHHLYRVDHKLTQVR